MDTLTTNVFESALLFYIHIYTRVCGVFQFDEVKKVPGSNIDLESFLTIFLIQVFNSNVRHTT